MKKSLKVIVSALAIFVLLVMLGKGINNPTGDGEVVSDNSTINVASYNIDSKDNPEAAKIIEQFKANNIEVIGVQEVDMNNDRNDFDMMADYQGEDFPYIHFSKGRDFANGEFGNGMISNLEFDEISSLPIDSSGGFATKTLERAVVTKGDKQVAIYNTHLSFESTELRKRQLFQILERVNNDPIAHRVILGDFNADSNIYEYSMFLNDYQLVNGYDGQWWNSFRLLDKEMKVYTVDNIIVSKNMEIVKSDMVESPLSDHNMLYASLKILDEEPAKSATGNIALGQKVDASSTYEKANEAQMLPAMVVDGDEESQWESAVNLKTDAPQVLTMELDKKYDISEMKLLWGDNPGIEYSVSVSTDGEKYELVQEVNNDLPANEFETIKMNKKNVGFIRLETVEFKQTDSLEYRGMMLKEWQVFSSGEAETKPTLSNENLLAFIAEGQTEQVLLQEVDNISISQKNGNFSIKNDSLEEATAQILIKDVNVKGSSDYQLAFETKNAGKETENVSIEIFPKTQEGNIDMANYSKVTDILRQNADTNGYNYMIHTASNIRTFDMIINISGGENVDDIEFKKFNLRQVEPLNQMAIDLAGEAIVGGKASLKLIADADLSNVEIEWQTSDPTVISIKNNQEVEFNKAGTANVTGVFKADNRYMIQKKIEVKAN